MVALAALTSHDQAIISSLSSVIPVVPFSSTSSSALLSFRSGGDTQVSAFKPRTASALRSGLFRSPSTLAALRIEAADRFMRWREVEHYMDDVAKPSQLEEMDWDKAAWEASLSEDIARRMHASTSSVSRSGTRDLYTARRTEPCYSPSFDPLHLRSLVMFSLSLLSPRKGGESWRHSPYAYAYDEVDPPTPSRYSGSRWKWGLAIVGIFCAGFGVGLVLSGSPYASLLGR